MRLARPSAIASLVLGFAVLAAGLGPEARAEVPRLLDPPDDSRVCAVLARAAEKALGIPEHLLRAVGVVESGRYDRTLGRAEPWPWTINAAGKGASFRAKADAIAEVERLQRSGVSSIDVGCMQVNLAYHGDAFESLDDAFDPVMNIAYAAHFLNTLKEERGTWSAAVAAYHSSTPERGIPYRRKVAKTWHGIRGTVTADAVKLRRAAVLETYQKRRAAFAEHQARVVKMQEERREARKKQREGSTARGVVELRGGTPPAESAPLPVEQHGGVGSATNGRSEAAVGRIAHGCFDAIVRDAAGHAQGFDPRLVQRILDISAAEGAESAFADDGFVFERNALFEDPEIWRAGPVEIVPARTGVEIQDPGPRSSVEIPDGPIVRADGQIDDPRAGCPRMIEQKASRGHRRAKAPSVIRG